MNISQAARETGLSQKTIRYYEGIKLAPAPMRKSNGYRDYSSADIELLGFLRQTRQFGFSIEECRALLDLYQNPKRQSAQVHQLVQARLVAFDQRIKEMQQMRGLLSDLVAACANDQQPHCAIMDVFSGGLNKVADNTADNTADNARTGNSSAVYESEANSKVLDK
ncbi:MAG: MerR family transcriptional regulator [Pseudomonadales bacterium]|nr:MerR family transcriptional regulator [Pseudomonadales bacterium]